MGTGKVIARILEFELASSRTTLPDETVWAICDNLREAGDGELRESYDLRPPYLYNHTLKLTVENDPRSDTDLIAAIQIILNQLEN